MPLRQSQLDVKSLSCPDVPTSPRVTRRECQARLPKAGSVAVTAVKNDRLARLSKRGVREVLTRSRAQLTKAALAYGIEFDKPSVPASLSTPPPPWPACHSVRAHQPAAKESGSSSSEKSPPKAKAPKKKFKHELSPGWLENETAEEREARLDLSHGKRGSAAARAIDLDA